MDDLQAFHQAARDSLFHTRLIVQQLERLGETWQRCQPFDDGGKILAFKDEVESSCVILARSTIDIHRALLPAAELVTKATGETASHSELPESLAFLLIAPRNYWKENTQYGDAVEELGRFSTVAASLGEFAATSYHQVAVEVGVAAAQLLIQAATDSQEIEDLVSTGDGKLGASTTTIHFAATLGKPRKAIADVRLFQWFVDFCGPEATHRQLRDKLRDLLVPHGHINDTAESWRILREAINKHRIMSLSHNEYQRCNAELDREWSRVKPRQNAKLTPVPQNGKIELWPEEEGTIDEIPKPYSEHVGWATTLKDIEQRIYGGNVKNRKYTRLRSGVKGGRFKIVALSKESYVPYCKDADDVVRLKSGTG